MNRLLTPRTYPLIDAELDRHGVFAKSFTQYVGDELTVVGMRIGVKPGHVVAFFGDRVLVRPSGTYKVQPAAVMTAPRFNYLCPVGTPVIAYPGGRSAEALHTVTKTPAGTTTFGKPVVMVEDHEAWIALTHIDVVGGAQ